MPNKKPEKNDSNKEVVQTIEVDEKDDFCFNNKNDILNAMQNKEAKMVGIPIEGLTFQGDEQELKVKKGTLLCEQKGENFHTVGVKGRKSDLELADLKK